MTDRSPIDRIGRVGLGVAVLIVLFALLAQVFAALWLVLFHLVYG
jgi:hypothetical protein